MISFRLIPDRTSIPFLRYRNLAYLISGALMALSVVLLPTKGLNFGIDFQGGTMIEVRMPGDAADLGGMRALLGGMGLVELALQEFGVTASCSPSRSATAQPPTCMRSGGFVEAQCSPG
jgi:preprotein translocase subunit SecF